MCRCPWEALLWQTVAIRNAEFWMVCSLPKLVGEAFRDHTGAAYVRIDHIRALKVMIMVS